MCHSTSFPSTLLSPGSNGSCPGVGGCCRQPGSGDDDRLASPAGSGRHVRIVFDRAFAAAAVCACCAHLGWSRRSKVPEAAATQLGAGHRCKSDPLHWPGGTVQAYGSHARRCMARALRAAAFTCCRGEIRVSVSCRRGRHRSAGLRRSSRSSRLYR